MLDFAPPVVVPAQWLLRIAGTFAAMETDILAGLGAVLRKRLGTDYLLVEITRRPADWDWAAAMFVRWNLPVHHSWPCCPRTTGFIEKAAQALAAKFAPAAPQTLLVGALETGGPGAAPYRMLASNLRGRALQLMPPECAAIRDASAQAPHAATLFCLVGREGLFGGLQSPAACRGFYPGGTKFIRQDSPAAISRAGAKVAEALHHLQLDHPLPAPGSHWLELGASPGGMTAELLARGYQVTAVDRAPLDPRLAGAAGLRAVLADAADYQPARGACFDAILCDMNGDPRESMKQVARLAGFLRPGGLVIFTLKLPAATTFAHITAAAHDAMTRAAAAGLQLVARHHLTYNRHEFTLVFHHPTPP